MIARVVGIGQRFAGDDAVGLAVAERVRALAPAGVEVLELDDASHLVDLLEGPGRVVLVDALVGGDEPGRVHSLPPEALEWGGLRALSTHGMGVTEAIALARALHPRSARPWIVGIEIAAPDAFETRLSPEVFAAVDRAAEMALSLARSTED